MSTINRQMSQSDEDVKQQVVAAFRDLVDKAFDQTTDLSMRELERKLWAWLGSLVSPGGLSDPHPGHPT